MTLEDPLFFWEVRFSIEFTCMFPLNRMKLLFNLSLIQSVLIGAESVRSQRKSTVSFNSIPLIDTILQFYETVSMNVLYVKMIDINRTSRYNSSKQALDKNVKVD